MLQCTKFAEIGTQMHPPAWIPCIRVSILYSAPNEYTGHPTAYLIFFIFSPQGQFLVKFFSLQKRVNCDKTDFAIKQSKSPKNDKLYTLFYISEISFTFLMWRIFPHMYITIYHVENFSTGTTCYVMLCSLLLSEPIDTPKKYSMYNV